MDFMLRPTTIYDDTDTALIGETMPVSTAARLRKIISTIREKKLSAYQIYTAINSNKPGLEKALAGKADHETLERLEAYVLSPATVRPKTGRPRIQVVPIEDRPIPTNTRSDYPVKEVKRAPHHEKQPTHFMPAFYDLACGPHGCLQQAEDYYTCEAYKGWNDVFIAKVRGDSMKNTLNPGDYIIMRAFGPQGLKLPRLEKEAPRNPIIGIRQHIPQQAVCMVSINDHTELTLKRIYYVNPEGEWHLLIKADNPHYEPEIQMIGRQDEVVFWGLVTDLALVKD